MTRKYGTALDAKEKWRRRILKVETGERLDISADVGGAISGLSQYGDAFFWTVLVSICGTMVFSVYFLVTGLDKARRAEQTIRALSVSNTVSGVGVSTNSPDGLTVPKGRGMESKGSLGSHPAEREGALSATRTGTFLAYVVAPVLTSRRGNSIFKAGIEPPATAPKVQAAPGPFASGDGSLSSVEGGGFPTFAGMLSDGATASSRL